MNILDVYVNSWRPNIQFKSSCDLHWHTLRTKIRALFSFTFLFFRHSETSTDIRTILLLYAAHLLHPISESFLLKRFWSRCRQHKKEFPSFSNLILFVFFVGDVWLICTAFTNVFMHFSHPYSIIQTHTLEHAT